MPRAREWSTTAKGTQEEVWVHRRSKALLSGGQEEKGWTAIGVYLLALL